MKKIKQVIAIGMAFAVGVGGICVTRLNAASTTFEQLKEENTNLSHEVATEGMVLLKNDANSLPLKNGEKVAVFGKGQIDFIKGGTGSGDVVAEYVRNVIQGLEMKGNKVNINQTLKARYEADKNYKPSESEVKNAANESDTAIVVITRNSGEGGDRGAGKGDYYLSDDETTLLDRVNKAGFDNVTVVLNIGGIMDTSWIANYPAVKSVLLAWQPGMEGGLAVADILCGDVNPSGKLTDTFAKSYDDYSTSNDYRENDWYLNYDEDIFVGYRYFETFDPTYEKVNYEFGYGLSYTDFRMSDVKVTNDNKNINVSVKVTNVGDVAGKEVAQVYFSAPQGKLGKPGKELAAYAKTKLLNPGESEVLNLSYAISDMSSYDDTGKVQKSAYLLEAGVYEIYVGNSIKDAGEHGARGTYFVKETAVTEQLAEEYAPIQLEKRLLADGTYEDLETFYEDENDKVCLDVADDKITKIEAEDFFHKHRYDEVDSNDNYTIFGLNNVTGEGNHWSSYALDIEKAGTYEITLRIANSRTVEDDNSVKVYIDDVAQDTEKVKISNTGGDWNLKDFGPITVNLPEGKHFLKFEFVNGGNNKGGFDYFTLKPKNVNTNEVVSNWKGKNYGNQGEKKVVIPESGAIMLQDVADNPSKMDDFMKQLTDQEMADLCRGHGTNLSYANTGSIGNLRKYGIPGAETADGPAGVRFNKDTPDTINGGNANISTTAWPIGTLVACTWNTPLVEEMGVAMGREAKHYKIDIMLAPGMNIHYNPLCGRNFEYYSEDPVVAGKTAAALARGMQTQKVACTIKHFAGNHKETNREYVDSRMSERALREIYLKGFEIAVKEGDPWCIMSCYNRINGEEPAQKADLLTDILRKEWGYKGIVMSDWNNDSSSYTEILAGNDVKMVNNETRQVRGALATGRMSREALETSARRILEMIIKTNALEKFEDFTYEIKSGNAIRLEAENYCDKESNVGFETCEDEGGGQNTRDSWSGRWLAFRINVKEAGTYTLKARTAYTSGEVKAKIKVDNKEVGSINTNTGSKGYQDWKTTDGIDIQLEAGIHELRYEFQNGYNLNWIELKKK